MTSRDRVINTLCHQASIPMPTLLRIPQLLEADRSEFCAQMRTRFQNDLDWVDFSCPVSEPKSKVSLSFANEGMSRSGLDEWGCVWEMNESGKWFSSEMPRYDDILEVEGISFPRNPVTAEMVESVNSVCDNSARFVVVQTRIHPFRRLCALGGVEAAKTLIQRKPRELKEIMHRLFDYYSKQLAVWCSSDADAIGIEDDLADENGLRISLPRWNEIFVPMLREFCARIREQDKFVYFTGSGNFEEFIPGLIGAGVDVVRFDAEAMDMALLAERYGHRITFQPVLKPEFIMNETEESLTSKILAWRSAVAENEIIAECQVPAQVGMRKIACAMLNWRRRMPQADNF